MSTSVPRRAAGAVLLAFPLALVLGACRGAPLPAPIAPEATVPRVPPPAEGRATIAGVLADSLTGQPVVGARVYLTADSVIGTGMARPRPGLPVDTTGTDGAFVLADVPPGRHTLATADLDHQPMRTIVVVRAGEVSTLVLRPRRLGLP